jgi:protein-tyrosine phosphatase
MRQQIDASTAKAEDYFRFMIALNQQLAIHHSEGFARMFNALLELDHGAFLVHCSSGKDRTGFACMLILHALGVPRDSILADYLRTNQMLSFERYFLPHLERINHAIPSDRAALLPLGTVCPEYMAAAYQAIEAEFGCVEVYLEQALGLNEAARRRLQLRFLE